MKGIVFNPVFPTAFLLAVALILIAISIFLLIRAQHRFRSMQIIAFAVFLTGVLGILLKPEVERMSMGEVLLLTRNFSKDIADSIVEAHRGIGVLSLGVDYDRATKLPSTHSLTEVTDNVRFLLGDGLPSYAIQALHGQPEYIPSRPDSGIFMLSSGENCYVNEPCVVSGVIRANKRVRMILYGPAGAEDSLIAEAGANSSFSLRFTPRSPGRFLYELATGERMRHAVPVVIRERRPLTILMLQSAPSFEMQFLKQYLSRNNRLFVRTQLSKGILRSEYINLKGGGQIGLGQDFLGSVDLIIADEETYLSLSRPEASSLLSSLKGGTGLLLLLNEKTSFKGKGKGELVAIQTYPRDTMALGDKSEKKLLQTSRARLGDSMTETGIGRGVQGYRYYGLGKVGAQLIRDTYRFYLKGDTLFYPRLWGDLVANVASSPTNAVIEVLSSQPVYAGEPVDFRLFSSERSPSVFFDSVAIPLREDSRVDGIWYGRTWATRTGWHTLYAPGDSVSNDFFVFEEGEWSGVRSANLRATSAALSYVERGADPRVAVREPFPPLVFYLLVLAGAAGLWLLPRLG